MGWKRDCPDIRDKFLIFPRENLEALPRKKDLRPKEHFPIYDQGSLGSCTANAIGAAFHFEQLRQGLRGFTPCRLFIYYNERAMEGSIKSDSGASLRDGISCLHKIGVCNEVLWAYNESKFTERPPEACYTEAAKNQAREYARVNQSLENLKACINEGFPFVFGFMVYSSFSSCYVSMTGRMSMPSKSESISGGHAVQACGYDDEEEVFIVRNSWGSSWGDNGYFYMPYEYICNPQLCSDFWAIRFVDGISFETKTSC
jgi:C1A family cysteine protease